MVLQLGEIEVEEFCDEASCIVRRVRSGGAVQGHRQL
jgi:hypothetical protein